MMTKTWLREAGISNVDAYFSLENEDEIKEWDIGAEEVTSRKYCGRSSIYYADHFQSIIDRMRIVRYDINK